MTKKDVLALIEEMRSEGFKYEVSEVLKYHGEDPSLEGCKKDRGELIARDLEKVREVGIDAWNSR